MIASAPKEFDLMVMRRIVVRTKLEKDKSLEENIVGCREEMDSLEVEDGM